MDWSPELENFTSFIEFSPFPMAMLDTELVYRVHNKKWINLLDLKGKRIIGKKHTDVFPGAPVKLTNEAKKILVGDLKYINGRIFDFKDKKGQSVRAKISLYPWKRNGEIKGIIATVQLVIGEIQKEIQLQETSELFFSFLKHAPIAVAMFDVDMNYVAVSDKWLEDYQLDGNIIGKNHYDIFPEIPEKWRKIHQKSLLGHSEKSDADILTRPDGNQDWFRWELIPWHKYDIETKEKFVAGIIMFAEIITPQIQEKMLLEETKNRLDLALEGSKAGVWDWNMKTGVTKFSKRWNEILGYQENEFENTYETWMQAIHENDREAVLKTFHNYVYGKISDYRAQYRMKTKEGNWKWILSRGKLVTKFNNEPIRMIGTHIDITEAKDQQEEIFQRQKMEAISRLVGGVAHDFNNQITIMRGYIDLIYGETDNSPILVNNLKGINQSLLKSEFLIKQLFSFSEKPKTEPKIVNINEKLKLLKPLLEISLGNKINISFDFDSTLENVKIDFSHLEQCLLNIINNSKDAMPNGGTIKVITSNNIKKDDEFLQIKNKKPENFVEIDISDSGTGMDTDILNRIYDPFFSTKEFGKGVGLGLAVVYNLVRSNDWLLDVKSIKNLGTVFRLFIPKLDPTATEKLMEKNRINPKGIIPNKSIDLSTFSILIIEDEDDLRYIVGKMLESKGFKNVIYAKDGLDGLKKWNELKGDINIILTDIVMPNMTGFELSKKIKEENPNLPIIFMTGYDKTQISIENEADISLINKPFSPDQLIRLIVSEIKV